MARWLVTGAAGFIGSHLVEELLRRGERVRGIDDFSSGHRSNLSDFTGRMELIEGDLGQPPLANRAVAGVDYVLHQAAVPSVSRSIAEPVVTDRANAGATVIPLKAAVDAGVRRVVYAASSSAYGDGETLPKVESMPPAPKSPYAASKLAGEMYCRAFHESYGLPTVALRYFNVFGPRQDPDSPYAAVIPRFVRALRDGKHPVIFGDGEQTRDFTYVANVVLANLLACTSRAAVGSVINVACGTRISLLDLLGKIGALLGEEAEPVFEPARAGDVKHSQADISRARQLLGYEPRVSIDEGLARTVAFFTGPRSQ